MKNKKGFTLVEVLIIVGIVGIVATIAIPNTLRYFGNAKKDASEFEKKSIDFAIGSYHSDTKFPNPLNDLEAYNAKWDLVTWDDLAPYLTRIEKFKQYDIADFTAKHKR